MRFARQSATSSPSTSTTRSSASAPSSHIENPIAGRLTPSADDGVIYHYPKTSRPPARDAAEVQATKNAMNHRLPIFVILPGATSQSRRSLKLGWVCDFDDANRQFLILFGDETPPPYSRAADTSEPFQLTEDPLRRASIVMARVGQQRFRFQVMSQYGHKCAVCDIRHPQLLKAAHICGKSARGTDDWRNGRSIVRNASRCF